MTPTSRKVVGGLIRIGLVILAVAVVISWLKPRTRRGPAIRVATSVPADDALGPGDLRIFNADSSLDLVLRGDKIYAGLSPKVVAKVQQEMNKDAESDTGLGGSIAAIVKKSVGAAIGTHVVYPVSDVREMHYDNGSIVVTWKDGSSRSLFKDVNVNGERKDHSFSQADAQRFIAAVQARQQGPAVPAQPPVPQPQTHP
jgi:hypothetical protein